MLEVLRRHVVDHIWCTPDQDYQSIYQPTRITRKNGVFQFVRTLRDRYRLPTDDQYHVFQIGQVPYGLLGIQDADANQWHSLSDLMNRHNLIIDAYTINGQQFPRFGCYLLKTTSRNVLVAVPRLAGLLDLNVESLFVRFYSNAYFASDRFTGSVGTYTSGGWIHTEQERNAFQAQHNTYLDRPEGAVKCIVDGHLIKTPSSRTIPLGSWAEFVYDASVERVVVVDYDSTRVFDSVLDTVRKQLVHLPKTASPRIVFKDDLDVHLFRAHTPNLKEGTYYHQNSLSHVRMVTHQDYSLPTGAIEQYATALPYWDAIDDVQLEIWVRRSGYERPLVHEHQRLIDLYRLPDDDIVPTLLGSTSGIAEWRAESLENSIYPSLMRTGDPRSLERPVIEEALGYNALVSLLNPLPVDVTHASGQLQVRRPPAAQGECLALEYDADGVLVGHDRLDTPDIYHYPDSSHASRVVFYPGQVGPISQCFAGDSVNVVPSGVSAKLYVCPMLSGEPTYDWREAVIGTDVLADEVPGGTEYTWQLSPSQYHWVVMLDTGVTWYTHDQPSDRQTVRFTLRTGVRTRGVWAFDVARLPCDYLQITMGQRTLVEGIDYTVEWPEVVVHTAQGLDPDAALQPMTVLMMGLPSDPNAYTPVKDVGYVVNQRLSDDHRHQVRDDRVVQVVIDGQVRHRDEVAFAEDGAITTPGVYSGRPYSIRTPPIVVDVEYQDRRQALLDSRDLDARLGQWMTQTYPSPPVDGPSLIDRKYVLISPFLSWVLFDLLSGVLDSDLIPEDRVTDVWLLDYLDWYMDLLPYDPARDPVDPHAVVRPHGYDTPVTVTRAQHTVLTRANHVLLDDRVELHELIRVGV